MRRIVPVLIVLLALSSAAAAQEVPDLSGTWRLAPERSTWTNRRGSEGLVVVFGGEFTVQQDETVLAMMIPEQGDYIWTFRLDGSQVVNTPSGPDGPAETSVVTWSGSELVITTAAIAPSRRTGRPGYVRDVRVLALEADGSLRVQAPWGPNDELLSSVYVRQP